VVKRLALKRLLAQVRCEELEIGVRWNAVAARVGVPVADPAQVAARSLERGGLAPDVLQTETVPV
jgi:hypothetical protein